ncbi:PREDICTED: uncharacterized protein LOC109479112 [Branchiostoma belcheri]|uniref:Uncharacterized protein LOC109479112 n=1 Tax=Branchiostoma belcheri TaxID=7741 RepID=A0A6P5A458_BRABE|nr:PREDICTED: uncharacterized protein LOC109479112 [Branchiostoma belcheri]
MRKKKPVVASMDLTKKKGHHSTDGDETKSSTQKRGVADSSNDGPAKRLRTNPPKVEPFYTLGIKEEEAAQPSTSGASTGAINKILYFYRGEYIAVRNDEGSFYLCEASQNIYNTSKTFKVRWLEVEDAPNIYRKSYYDNIELESIITHVKLQRMEKDKYVLPQAEILKTQKILRRAITGIAEDDEDEVLDVKEEEKDETVTPKKTQAKAKLKAKKTKAPIRTRAKKVVPPAVKRGRAAVKKAIAKVTKKGKSAPKKGKASKAPAKQTATMIKEELLKKLGKGGPLFGPDKKLTPRADMKVPEKDPSFEERSTPSHLLPQKQSIRAVLLNDMKLLRSLIADTTNIPTVYDAQRSVDVPIDAVMYAIRNRNKDAIKLFGDHMKKHSSNPRCSRPYSLLKHQGTGRYNWYSLGHAVRNISMSRGSKEGNNAFTKDIDDGLDDYTETYGKEVLQTGATKRCSRHLYCCDTKLQGTTQKRGVADSSNDGPAKRLRTNPPKVEPFYTLGIKEEEAAQPSTSGASTGAINKILYFYRGEYIAVRNDEGSFYLCEASQNIYNTSKTFKVRWLEVEDAPNIYRKSYYDNIELESIITHVKLQRMEKDKYVLPQAEILKTQKILRRAITGIAEDDEDEVLDVKEEEKDETVTPKKTRAKAKLKAKKTKAPIRTRAKKVVPPAVKRGRAAVKKAIAKVTKKGKSAPKKGKASKAPAKQTATMIKEELLKKLGKGGPLFGPDKKLTPRADMKVPEKDPSFEERSTPSHLLPQKQSIRAVLLNDMKLLRSLIADTTNIPTVYDAQRSVDVPIDAVMYAIRNRNKDAIKLFGDHMKKHSSNPRCSRPYSLLKHQGTDITGTPLGHAVRNISMSRGSKEGNNAFTKDIDDGLDDYTETYGKEVLQTGAPKDVLDICIAVIPNFKNQLFDNIYLAVRAGHRKLAGKLIEMAEKGGGYGFNQLHKEVLLFDKQELTTFRAVSVKKKPYGNQVITPLHCAAINPNPKYLQKLLAVCPEFGLTDRTGRKPIHYAAACEGSGPLEFLLSRGMSAEDGDNQANTALMIAAENGRANNVDLILKKLKAQAKDAGEDPDAKAAYISLIQRANRQSFAAIHLAAKGGYGNVVKILHKHGANLDQPLSAGKNKMTALMLASAQGHLGTVKVLTEIGATLEKRDKLKRTALTHAAMNGHYPVLAFLLRMGADPNSMDTSGNSVAHYAAGYGWWHCLKLLLKVGADPNKPNDWKVTPVGIAVLKGNADCADLLLDLKGPDGQPLADVNFKDEKGLTMVAMLAASPLSTGLPQQICYLIKRNADITIPDLEGWTPLHYLAQNPIKQTSGWGHTSVEADKNKADMSLEIANILLDKAADPSLTTASGMTPIMLAIEQFNVGLVRLLVKRGGTISASSATEDKDTTLHLLAKNCMLEDLTEILQVLVEQVCTCGLSLSDDCSNTV